MIASDLAVGYRSELQEMEKMCPILILSAHLLPVAALVLRVYLSVPIVSVEPASSPIGFATGRREGQRQGRESPWRCFRFRRYLIERTKRFSVKV